MLRRRFLTLITIALVLSDCAKKTAEQIADDEEQSYLGFSFGPYLLLYFYCFLVHGLASTKFGKTQNMEPAKLWKIGHLFLIFISVLLLANWLSLELTHAFTSSARRTMILLTLPFHLAVLLYAIVLYSEVPKKRAERRRQQLEREEQTREAIRQQDSAERERASKQALLEQHAAEQSANLKAHKRRIAAKHIAELAHYASELDGSAEDSSALTLMLRSSDAFLEDPDLVAALKEIDSLQSELCEILLQLRRVGQEDRPLFNRLSRWRS
jgi:hypothetical protein